MGDEEKKALMSVIDSGWYTEASKTREFEKTFAKFVGSRYACAVTSGTAALYLGLKALGINRNDEVIVPDLTFVASANAIEATGGRSVFVDIESKTLNLDLKKNTNLINKKTKAIMPVDFNGRCTDFTILKEIADKNNLFLIEDACHAIGSYYGRKHMGTRSEIGIFSFSTPKIITTGQGGMIVTDNKNLYEKCMALKDFGRKIGVKAKMKRSFEHETIGYNFKFTEFQAAVGIAQMKKLRTRIKKKKDLFKEYKQSLSKINELKFIETDLEEQTPWMMDVIIKSKNIKNKLIDFLNKKQIGTRIFYPPLHRLKPYKTKDGRYKTASTISDRGLWLPSSVTLTERDTKTICNTINQFFKSSLT